MSFSTYPSYRELDTDGLGMVPTHWDAMPGKRALVTRSGGTAIKGSCADQPAEGLVQGFSASGPDVWLENAEFFGPGLVLSAVGARCGKVFKADGHWGTVANTHSLFPRSNIDRDFAWYLTNNEAWWEKGGSAQPFIKVSETLGRRIALPPLSEQRAIAAFLDRETGKIDALIEEQKRLIALLKEKRQAVISHAVTKGLNPDAPMKDSGVDWLGEVPEHWEVWKFSRCVSIAEGQVNPEVEPYSSMPLIAPNHIESATGRLLELEIAVEQGATSGKYYCNAGDIVYSKIRPGLAKVIISPVDALCSADMYPMRGTHLLSDEYLLFILLSSRFVAWSVLESDRVAMPKINRDSLAGLRLPIPPMDEQIRIAGHIGSITTQVDSLGFQAQAAISLLQERRSALISAAVTGKIDVRGLVTPEEIAA